MSDTQNPAAVLPDIGDKSASIQVVEDYIRQADDALIKIQESLTKLRANVSQREKEFLVVSGQRELLMALQKNITEKEVTDQTPKPIEPTT